MKIIIATDSYKGSHSSPEAAELILKGVTAVFPDADIIKIPVGDGGEGTVESLMNGRNGKIINLMAEDPLGRRIQAFYGVLKGKAVLEMAVTGGLTLLKEDEKDPRWTSTFGTGETILAALEAGFRDITIGIGGSASNDGGAGMAQALGYRLLDEKGKELPRGGAGLADVVAVDDSSVTPLLQEAKIHVACDVDNPLLGEQGATAVYGPQKGAGPDMVKELDATLCLFADVVEAWMGKSVRDIPGAGAAGGLGFGLLTFCNAEIKSGIDTVLDLVNFEDQISGADLIITGEGKIDGQSVRGKVPVGVASRARDAGIPVLAIAGSIGSGAFMLYHHGIDSIMCTVDKPMMLAEAIERSAETLQHATERACRIIHIGMRIANRSGV